MQHGRGAQHRMAGKVQFLILGEDPQPAGPAGQIDIGEERRLELADLARQVLHHRGGQAPGVQDHDKPVASQRPPAEYVNVPVLKIKHGTPIPVLCRHHSDRMARG